MGSPVWAGHVLSGYGWFEKSTGGIAGGAGPERIAPGLSWPRAGRRQPIPSHEAWSGVRRRTPGAGIVWRVASDVCQGLVAQLVRAHA